MSRSHIQVSILTSSLASALLYVSPIAAQVIPDATLPAGGRSQVTGNPNFQIDGGAIRGSNLFHSFSEFSIPTGGSAFFNNAPTITNIFSRITGTSISNIDGLIRANGTANLFVLNPNGILFGPNASLNIGGSFIATTASAIGFPNGEVFSSDATQPLPSQLLNVNANALFFNQLAAQAIVHQSTANNRIGLQVPAGQSLLLVGGDVRLEGGQIISPGSRVELGAVAGQGIVGLSETAGDWRLSFPDSVVRSDVSLSNGAVISARAGGGGSIAITARNVTLSEFSRLRAGINDGLGFAGAQAGDIQLDVTETVTLNGSSIGNVVRPRGTGNAGNINITAGSLALTGVAQMDGSTYGQGDASSININARETVSLDESSAVFNNTAQTGVGNTGGINIITKSLALTGGSQLIGNVDGQGNTGGVNINARETVSLDESSAVINNVAQTGVGNTGGINIITKSLALTGGSQLIGNMDGQGNAGSVNVNARETVSFNGSAVFMTVGETGIGNIGGINISAGSLALTEGSQIDSSTFGQGNAGSVNINARDTVVLDGENADLPTAILNNVGTGGIGNVGGINIQAQNLVLRSNAALTGDVEPSGRGQGGDINLDISGTILLLGGTTAGTGESARITLGVQPEGIGSGGDLRIRSGALVLQDGGLIKASTQGQGNAGNIDIQADRVDISGSVPSSGLPSGLFTSSDTAGSAGNITIQTQTFRIADGAALSARSRGDGQGGDITVNATRTFEAVNGGQLITTTFGQGQAGNITVSAGEQITIAGSDPNYADRLARFPNPIEPFVANAITETGPASGLFANTEPNSTGRGGNIQITTGQFTVQAGAQLITSTNGSGQAGDITVNAPDIQLSGADSGLFAQTTTAADAGDLTIQPRGNGQSVRVNLQDGAQISASTSSSGRGGTLTITAPDSITLTGNGSIITAETEGSGTGGNLSLQTDTLRIQDQAEVTVSSFGIGSAGNLFVDADRILLNNRGRIRADTSGGGGDISLRSPFILLRNGSNISTNARGENIPGGNIGIDTQFLIAVPSEDSNISANSENFRGGNVSINAFSLFGIRPSPISTPLSDITATGATTALPGTIDVTTAGLDPTSGLVELPADLADASGLIAQGCPADKGNSFVITGRGGLPPTPQQELDDDVEWDDREILTVAQQRGQGVTETRRNGDTNSPHVSASSPPRVPPPAIIEATGWQKTATGDVILVANTPDPTIQNAVKQSVDCHSRR